MLDIETLKAAQRIFRAQCYARGYREGREEIEVGLGAMTELWATDASAGAGLLLTVARHAVIDFLKQPATSRRRPMPFNDPAAQVEPGIAEWARERAATNPEGAAWVLTCIACPNKMHRGRVWSAAPLSRKNISTVKRLLAEDFEFRRSHHSFRQRPERIIRFQRSVARGSKGRTATPS